MPEFKKGDRVRFKSGAEARKTGLNQLWEGQEGVVLSVRPGDKRVQVHLDSMDFLRGSAGHQDGFHRATFLEYAVEPVTDEELAEVYRSLGVTRKPEEG